jgi:hypothetical protein
MRGDRIRGASGRREPTQAGTELAEAFGRRRQFPGIDRVISPTP